MSDSTGNEEAARSPSLREQHDLLGQLLEVDDEYIAAREVKDKDPARWAAAKQARAESRSYWRQIAEIHGLRGEGAGPNDVAVTAEPVKGKARLQGKEV